MRCATLTPPLTPVLTSPFVVPTVGPAGPAARPGHSRLGLASITIVDEAGAGTAVCWVHGRADWRDIVLVRSETEAWTHHTDQLVEHQAARHPLYLNVEHADVLIPLASAMTTLLSLPSPTPSAPARGVPPGTPQPPTPRLST